MNMPARAERNCTFRTGQRGLIWQVTRDGAFYGDYRSQRQALAAACFGARAADAKGLAVRVLDGPEETVIPHQLPSAPS